MDFLGILKGALGVIGDVTGIGILKQASAAIETISPETKIIVQNALMQHEMRMKELAIEEYKATGVEALTEIQSDDKFTKRARPFGVYCASICTLGIVAAMICGAKFDYLGLIAVITPLWGNAGFYTYSRTKEKLNGNGG